ncbi:transporter substrate-binding domain-containing protein [Brucella sp. 21LCYQ03]|nr:transporter substrate-binding domain-containing protein [Brucella sp. 21LCYQ03]
MRSFFCFILYIGLLISGSSSSLASEAGQSRLDEIRASGILKVGTTGDYRPFTFRNTETGVFEGFDIEQAENLAKALGVKLQLVETTWSNLSTDFASDKFDIAMGGVSVTLERQKTGSFSLPYLEDGKAPLTRCEDKDKFVTLSIIDKPSVKVIVNPAGTNELFVRKNLKESQIVLWKDNKSIFDALAGGKADLMITDAIEARYQQKKYPGIFCVASVEKPFTLVEKAYWIQRDPDLTAFVNQWLHLSKKDGSFDAIYSKWLN